MPQAFLMTISGIPLKRILDPLARSDVSIGQSPCDLLRATPKTISWLPFRDQEGGDARATRVIPA